MVCLEKSVRLSNKWDGNAHQKQKEKEKEIIISDPFLHFFYFIFPSPQSTFPTPQRAAACWWPPRPPAAPAARAPCSGAGRARRGRRPRPNIRHCVMSDLVCMWIERIGQNRPVDPVMLLAFLRI